MAHLAADRDYVTENPAIVIDSYGEGHWAAFTYDLAESTVLFHQGLREQASTGVRPDPGGEYQYKTNDLFVGYLDPELGHLPQADLHQDALVRILDWMASLSRPLPRLWHFPDGSPALAMFTGDSDGMSMDDFANTIATADRFGIPYTTYLRIEHHARRDARAADGARGPGSRLRGASVCRRPTQPRGDAAKGSGRSLAPSASVMDAGPSPTAATL